MTAMIPKHLNTYGKGLWVFYGRGANAKGSYRLIDLSPGHFKSGLLLRNGESRYPESEKDDIQPFAGLGSCRATDDKGISKDGKKAKKEAKEVKKKKKKEKKSTSSPSDDSSSAANDLELDDCASLFGLGRKDLTRPAGSIRLDDLTCRQLGFAVSNVVEAVTPSDIFEIGGELEGLLLDRAATAKRNKHMTEHNTALFEASQAELVNTTPYPLVRKLKTRKAAFGEELEKLLNKLREEASLDLKKCLGKPEQTTETKPTKKRKKDKKGETPPPPPPKKAKMEKKPEPKEEVKEESEDDFLDEGDVPNPPSEGESASEAEPEAEVEDSDDGGENDDDGDDEDIFAGDYKDLKKKPSREQLLETLPPALAAQKSKLEDGLLAAIPTDLSKSDFDSWIGVLLKEQMLSLDEVKECRGLEGASDAQYSGAPLVCLTVCLGPHYNSRGPLSSHLSVSKKYFNKLSIKGKKLFDSWVDSLRFPDKAGLLCDFYFFEQIPLDPKP
ncbi:unnamed protein product [Symbiodinium sp. KB8]|nr:unnamed protein product [Symbiodinium sp. KB8]